MDALQSIQFYYMMRWLHKLRLLVGAREHEKHWRISEIYHEIYSHASNLKISEEKAKMWRKLAEQLEITFPFDGSERGGFENEDVIAELENVD